MGITTRPTTPTNGEQHMQKPLSKQKRLLWFSPVMGLLLGIGGCLPSQFGSDLLASTIAAVTGDVVFTTLDYVLPSPPD